MGGAKAVMRELTEFAEQAKSRLREDRPIKQERGTMSVKRELRSGSSALGAEEPS